MPIMVSKEYENKEQIENTGAVLAKDPLKVKLVIEESLKTQ